MRTQDLDALAHSFDCFAPSLFEFLEALTTHNERDWFQAHKADYAREVQSPALSFIAAMIPYVAAVSPHFRADPRKVGGSLMRVYRDTRFSADKTPYKTNVGIQFRHEAGKDVHAPGMYLHVQPGECFLGVGIWHPDPPALARVRAHIASQPQDWLDARNHAPFQAHFALGGESASRPPQGFDRSHPLIEDLKRKDFIAMMTLTPETLRTPGLPARIGGLLQESRPFLAFLCQALELPF